MVSTALLALSVCVQIIAPATGFAIHARDCVAARPDSSSSIAVSNHVSTAAPITEIAITVLATALKDISLKIVPCANACRIARVMESATTTRVFARAAMVGNGQIVREDSVNKAAMAGECTHHFPSSCISLGLHFDVIQR
jgi:hypothetical protein